jgi:hypothetical protein
MGIGFLRDSGRGTKMEHAMLALIIEHFKLLVLFALVGTMVTLSRFGGRQEFSPAPPRESGDPAP